MYAAAVARSLMSFSISSELAWKDVENISNELYAVTRSLMALSEKWTVQTTAAQHTIVKNEKGKINFWLQNLISEHKVHDLRDLWMQNNLPK